MDQPWIYGATWFIYAIGAIAGALLFRWQGPAALVLPLAALVAVCATLVS